MDVAWSAGDDGRRCGSVLQMAARATDQGTGDEIYGQVEDNNVFSFFSLLSFFLFVPPRFFSLCFSAKSSPTLNWLNLFTSDFNWLLNPINFMPGCRGLVGLPIITFRR